MLKRGTKIEYTYAGGKVVQGVVVKPQPINFYQKHGVDLWYAVKLADEAGSYEGSVHYGQVRNVDNRAKFRASLVEYCGDRSPALGSISR